MKLFRFLPLLFLVLSVVACKKDDAKPTPTPTDPRDMLVGTYSVTAVGTCTDADGATETFSVAGTLQVKKGSNTNQLLFTDSGASDYPVTMNGKNFTIPVYDQYVEIDGEIISVEVNGSGSFSDNSINYIEISDYVELGVVCTGQVSGAK